MVWHLRPLTDAQRTALASATNMETAITALGGTVPSTAGTYSSPIPIGSLHDRTIRNLIARDTDIPQQVRNLWASNNRVVNNFWGEFNLSGDPRETVSDQEILQGYGVTSITDPTVTPDIRKLQLANILTNLLVTEDETDAQAPTDAPASPVAPVVPIEAETPPTTSAPPAAPISPDSGIAILNANPSDSLSSADKAILLTSESPHTAWLRAHEGHEPSLDFNEGTLPLLGLIEWTSPQHWCFNPNFGEYLKAVGFQDRDISIILAGNNVNLRSLMNERWDHLAQRQRNVLMDLDAIQHCLEEKDLYTVVPEQCFIPRRQFVFSQRLFDTFYRDQGSGSRRYTDKGALMNDIRCLSAWMAPPTPPSRHMEESDWYEKAKNWVTEYRWPLGIATLGGTLLAGIASALRRYGSPLRMIERYRLSRNPDFIRNQNMRFNRAASTIIRIMKNRPLEDISAPVRELITIIDEDNGVFFQGNMAHRQTMTRMLESIRAKSNRLTQVTAAFTEYDQLRGQLMGDINQLATMIELGQERWSPVQRLLADVRQQFNAGRSSTNSYESFQIARIKMGNLRTLIENSHSNTNPLNKIWDSARRTSLQNEILELDQLMRSAIKNDGSIPTRSDIEEINRRLTALEGRLENYGTYFDNNDPPTGAGGSSTGNTNNVWPPVTNNNAAPIRQAIPVSRDPHATNPLVANALEGTSRDHTHIESPLPPPSFTSTLGGLEVFGIPGEESAFGVRVVLPWSPRGTAPITFRVPISYRLLLNLQPR